MTLVGLVVLLWAERADRFILRCISKPVASLGFLLVAWTQLSAGAYGQRIMLALAFCALGDLLLIPNDERAFRAGIAAFALGHLGYLGAFFTRGPAPWVSLIGVLFFGAVGYGVWRVLAPSVDRPLRAPVQGYIAVISCMTGTALAVALKGDLAVGVAAFLFFVSDLSVARDAFVKRAFVNRAWGLPTYYAAQLIFAMTAGQP